MTKKKTPTATTPVDVNETRLELLEKELNTLVDDNASLKDENVTLREKISAVNEKFAAATKGVQKKQRAATIFVVGEDRYEFKYPAYNYEGRKISAEDIAKDLNLLEIFIKQGNATKL